MTRKVAAINLIAVVASIALLAGLLLPALRTVREGTVDHKCLANIRSITQAMNIYATIHGSYPAPTTRFRGDCAIATLYWQGLLREKRYCICPSTTDDQTLLPEPIAGQTGWAAYPISYAAFDSPDGVAAKAISYAARTTDNIPNGALATPLDRFTEKALTGSPVVSDAPGNHSDIINVGYSDESVIYLNQPPTPAEESSDLQTGLRYMDPGD